MRFNASQRTRPLDGTTLRLVVLLAALAMALVGAACGGSGDKATVQVQASPTASPTPIGPTPTPSPPPELLLASEEVYQGGAIQASLVGDIRAGTITFLGQEYTLIQGSQSYFTFIGIAPEDEPGTFPLRIEFELGNGSTGSLTQDVTILENEWTVEALDFDPELDDLLGPEVRAAEDAYLADLYAEESSEKLWDGAWQYPLQGEMTARFGEQRSVNGGPATGHHSGMDIGVVTGTPVMASNSGRVVLAEELQIRGNTVIIDHGGGLYSGYSHLNEIAVTVGQDVASGEVIAYSGNTGLSTGPHLHWEAVAHGVAVDPLRFVDGTNGF